MKKTRIVALILALALTLCLFTGCDKKKETEFDKLAQAYTADTVIAKAGDIEITWGLYVATLYTSIAALEGSYGQIPAWDRELGDGNYSDFIKEYALYEAMYYAALETMALDLGLVLTAADEAKVEEMWQGYAEQLGGEEKFIENIQSMHCSPEVYRYMLRMQYTTELILNTTYGEDGALITQEQIEAYAQEQGYYCAKIICILTRDPETQEPYDDVKRTRLLTRAKGIVEKLDAYEGDDLVSYFEELSAQENEDAAKEYFPTGYVFGETDLGEVVHKATGKLEEYQYSEVISSDYGYYIILRMPMDPTITPVVHANTLLYSDKGYPLRTVVADSYLNEDITELQEAMEVTRTEEYESLFLGTYLTKPVTLTTEE